MSDLEVPSHKNGAKIEIIILSRLKRGVALRPPRSLQRTAVPTARGFERKSKKEKERSLYFCTKTHMKW